MFIIDPNNPAAGGDSSADGAAAATGAQDGKPDTGAPEPTAAELEAAEMAAIDKALEEPDGGDPAKPKEDDKPKEGEGGDEGEDGKPAGDKKPEEGKDKKEGDGKDKPDAEIQAQADALGLKGKSNERFVEMATEIKGFAPLKAELEKAGVKSVEDVVGLVQKSQAADSMIAMVMETGANEEQYGATLDYLTVLNRAQKGDHEAAEQAFAMIGREYAELAKALGKEVPGVHDPLAEYPDLVKEVGDGDLPRERALEIAGQRRQAALLQQARQTSTQQQQQTQAEQVAVTKGVEALRQWEASRLADPTYVALRPALNEQVVEIRKNFPPSQWPAATELAYRALVAEAAAAAKQTPAQRKVPISPMRPGAGGDGLAPKKFASDLEAVDAALESL